jgi:hypothetical protein
MAKAKDAGKSTHRVMYQEHFAGSSVPMHHGDQASCEAYKASLSPTLPGALTVEEGTHEVVEAP